MPEREPDPYRPPTQRSAASGLLPAVLAVAIAAGAGWWFWWRPAHAPVAPPVSYTHLTLPTNNPWCRSRWSPYH